LTGRATACDNHRIATEDARHASIRRVTPTPGRRAGRWWYDRMVAALRVKDRPERLKALATVEAEAAAISKKASAMPQVLRMFLPRKAATEVLGDSLIGLLLPAVAKVAAAADRVGQVGRNLRLALALSAYRADHGKYPEKLDALAPKYLPTVPGDLFSGGALVYRLTDTGYLLYSVGVNGKDDSGRTFGDNPAGDDLRVRMPEPLPPP
jgi:hypothetical protein